MLCFQAKILLHHWCMRIEFFSACHNVIASNPLNLKLIVIFVFIISYRVVS